MQVEGQTGCGRQIGRLRVKVEAFCRKSGEYGNNVGKRGHFITLNLCYRYGLAIEILPKTGYNTKSYSYKEESR